MPRIVAVVDSTRARGEAIAEQFQQRGDTVACTYTGTTWSGHAIPDGACATLVFVHHANKTYLEHENCRWLARSTHAKMVFYSGGRLPPLPEAFTLRETVNGAIAARSLLTVQVVEDILAWAQGEKAVAPEIIAGPASADRTPRTWQRAFRLLCEGYLLLHACNEQNGKRSCNREALPGELSSQVESLADITSILTESVWKELDRHRILTETQEYWMLGYQKHEVLLFAQQLGLDENDMRCIIGRDMDERIQERSEAVRRIWATLAELKRE